MFFNQKQLVLWLGSLVAVSILLVGMVSFSSVFRDQVGADLGRALPPHACYNYFANTLKTVCSQVGSEQECRAGSPFSYFVSGATCDDDLLLSDMTVSTPPGGGGGLRCESEADLELIYKPTCIESLRKSLVASKCDEGEAFFIEHDPWGSGASFAPDETGFAFGPECIARCSALYRCVSKAEPGSGEGGGDFGSGASTLNTADLTEQYAGTDPYSTTAPGYVDSAYTEPETCAWWDVTC